MVSRVVVLSLAIAPLLGAQRTAAQRTPLPATGIDYSAIDEFYRIADLLAQDVEPTDAQWQTMRFTPGYRLVEIDNPGIQRRMQLAFKPSLRAARDSVAAHDDDQARVLAHLVHARERREPVARARMALERTLKDSIALALRRTQRFLPAGAIEQHDVPLVGVAVFMNDGYATGTGVILDVVNIMETGAVDLLAHEFHHEYLARYFDRSRGREDFAGLKQPPADAGFFSAMVHLRNEGIADQIDKPFPLPVRDSADWYSPRYNETYRKTPVLLHTLDSLMVAYVAQPNPLLARRAANLFWSSGHPNGAYMARQVNETFGVDSLLPALANPVRLVRAYIASEVKQGRPSPLSAQSRALLDSLETKYVKP